MNGRPIPPSAARTTSLRSLGAAFLLALAAMLMAPVAARTQDAATMACAADTVTQITNGFIKDQTNAALQAVGKMYPIDDGSLSPDAYNAAKAAWRTLRDAAETNFANAVKDERDARAIADRDCGKAWAQDGISYKGPEGVVYCAPVTESLGTCTPTGGPLCRGQFAYPWPTWYVQPGISKDQQPITVIAHDCSGPNRTGAIATVVTPPPPDDTPPPGGGPPDTFWSGSSIVGFLPCPPQGNAFGCPPKLPKTASISKSPVGGNVCTPTKNQSPQPPQPPPLPPIKLPGPTASNNPPPNVCNKPTPPSTPKNPCNSAKTNTPPPTSGGKMNGGTCSTANGKTTCTDNAGHSCTTTSDICDPAAPPLPGKTASTTTVPVCESKPQMPSWGGTSASSMTVSIGNACGIGWVDSNGVTLDHMSITTNPSHGNLKQQGKGQVIYTPSAGYTGSDSFSVSIQEHYKDGRTATAHSNVTVTIK